VMNLFWVVVLSLLIFLEQVPFLGRQVAPLAGIVLIAAGAWLLSMGMS
jgi:predicted metal-binding membrane protein